MRRVPTHLTIVTMSLLVTAAFGIDPDIQRALQTAPPPGDYNGGMAPRSLNSLQAKPEVQTSAQATATYLLRSKLLHIRVPKLVFQDTPARAAFQWLAEQSAALDPQHQGVSFVFDLRPSPRSPNDNLLDHTVTLSHEDVPLDEAIHYVTAALNLRFEVEKGVVVIRPQK